jgi:hypothetical protein
LPSSPDHGDLCAEGLFFLLQHEDGPVMSRNWLACVALLATLLVAGCADNAAADKDRPSGFYGGVSAGGVMH